MDNELVKLSQQFVRNLQAQVYIVDSNFGNYEQIIGDVIDFPSFNINSESDIRRTCSLSIYPRDYTFDIKKGSNIWMDKYIYVSILQYDDLGVPKYHHMGYYVIGNPQKVYSPTENKLTFQGMDLMCKLTGLRSGNLEGVPYIIPQGSNVKEVMETLLKASGFNNFDIEDLPITVPNDINIGIGSTVYDILKQLRDLLPNYEMYFNVNGVFCFNKIPTGENEIVIANDEIWDYNLLDYKRTVDFDYVKNSIEVIGKPHETQRYFDNLDIENDAYVVRYPSDDTTFKGLNIGEKVAFSTNKRLTTFRKFLKIYIGEELKYTYPLYDEQRNRPIFNREDGYYVFKVGFEEGSYWTVAERKELSLTAQIEDNHFVLNDDRYPDILSVGTGEYSFNTPIEGADLIENPIMMINSEIVYIDAEHLENNKQYTIQQYEDSTNIHWNIIGEKDVEYYNQVEIVYDEDDKVHLIINDESLTEETINQILKGEFIYTFKTENIDNFLEIDSFQLANNTSPSWANFIITKGYWSNYYGYYQLEKNKIYTVEFHPIYPPEYMFYLTYLGGSTPYAKVQETKKSSPFHIGSGIGVINKVLSGGEYDNISTDSLALQRAEWELYNYCRLNDSVSINCIPLYWLDVNKLIEITLPNSIGEESTELYMIKSISISGGKNPSQSINLVKYYPYDPSDDDKCYGFRIYSRYDTELEYIEDAIGMTPARMDYEKGEFNYGDWEDAFFMPKPCMLTRTGEVDYYLNPYDYRYKLDGTESDISNVDYEGNAMMEWGTDGRPIYLSIKPLDDNKGADVYIANYKKDDTFQCYSFYDRSGNVTNHFYTAIYNGSVIDGKLRSLSGQTVVQEELDIETIKNNGGAYELEQYSDRLLINMLLLLIGKNRNSQKIFGNGVCDGTIKNTGTCDNKGLFYGTNEYSTAVKIFGMENYWGNVLRTVWGDVAYTPMTENYIDRAVKMTQSRKDGTTTNNYYELDSDGKPIVTKGFLDINDRIYEYHYNDYILEMKYSDYGAFPCNWTTTPSSSNYYCDVEQYVRDYHKNGLFAQYGGMSDLSQENGMFFKRYDSKVYSSSSLSYKPFSYDTKILVTYIIDDEQTTIEYNYGVDCLHPPIIIPTKEGLVFKGWSFSVDGEVLKELKAEEETVLYAIYKVDEEKDPITLEDFYLSGGFQETQIVKEIDTTGYKYITFTCGGSGTTWLMHPNEAGWAYLYVGFNRTNSYGINVQNSHYIGTEPNNSFDRVNWLSDDKTFTIDISELDGLNEFQAWLYDSPNGKYYLTMTNVTLHN